jgi:uncharacterized protein (DUF433 family)
MTRRGSERRPSPDAREVPAYPLAEVARYLHLAPATLRTWVKGRDYPTEHGPAFFQPLIKLPDASQAMLSFSNLIEAHVLLALRTEHAVSIKAVREALVYAERAFRIKRLLLSPELRTDAGRLFLDRYGELVELSPSGQLAMRTLLEAYLARIDRDVSQVPIRLYPFVRGEVADGKRIAITPLVAFGRPVIARMSIATAAIVDRIDAGEGIDEVAADYGLDRRDVEDAVLYERAA